MTVHRILGLGFLAVGLAAACSATSKSELEEGSGSGQGANGTTSSTASLGVGGTTSSGFGEECGKTTFGNQVPGALLVVFDQSGSMEDPPSMGGTSKWHSSVLAMKAMVNAADPALEIGLLPFPAGKFDSSKLALCLLNAAAPGCPELLADAGCSDVSTTPDVPIAPLQQNAPALVSWLDQNSPNGGTPTLFALKHGYDIVRDYPAKGQRFVLLVTDGEPNVATPAMFPFPAMSTLCGSEADIEKTALDAFNGTPSVATFVIGSPGSEGGKDFLSRVAQNGGTAKDPACSPAAGNCHYQIGTADFEKELADVLSQIAGVVSDCIFDMPEGEDIDPNLVNVTIETGDGPKQVFKDPSHVDGWDYSDGAQSQIKLYGPACELYKAQEGNTITIVLGCETILK